MGKNQRSRKWEGQGVEEHRDKRETACERKVCCRNVDREFCHVQHVVTRHICHSDHMYFSPLQQTTTLQLAAYCVHCFLRQCMRVFTMAPPTPPSSFVSHDCLDGLLGLLLFLHSLTFFTSGAVLWKGREAMASAPRKGAHAAAEASPSGPRRV